jgi:hypothetical protein
MQATMAILAAPLIQRTAAADVVIVGKVTNIQEKTVKAARFPGDEELTEHLVAIVKVEQDLFGAKGVTHIPVAFPVFVPAPRGPGIRPGIRRITPVQLSVDQEGAFILTRHGDEDFFVLRSNADFLPKTAPNFDKNLEELQKTAAKVTKILAKPEAALKAKDAEDRLTAVAVLLARYQAQPIASAKPRTEPADAAVSRLVLETLAEADWESPIARVDPYSFVMPHPQNLFSLLALQPEEGWTPPADFKTFPEAAKKWLQAHKTDYRLKRYVAGEAKDEKPQDKK